MNENLQDACSNQGIYLNRKLLIENNERETVRSSDHELLQLDGPAIILGEPGMGKTQLMRYLGKLANVEPVSAIRFMNAKDPLALLQPNRPLIIDGLDEAMARREGDAVDRILAQLETAGNPKFIISCRAREWENRTARNLTQIYGREPTICILQKLSRHDAEELLKSNYPKVDPSKVINHLNDVNLADLYTNPLTLGLLGTVAQVDDELPKSKGTLFKRVSEIIWAEHDEDRSETDLSKLTTEGALASAGAIFASLLLSGKENVFFGSAAHARSEDLLIWEIEKLPNGSNPRTILTSKLFVSMGSTRAKPIHKVIAEFLGAQWLAQNASTQKIQRRLLDELSVGGTIPSSLRGLFAWLAYHSSAMAPHIIYADAYGILRYGDADNLSPREAEVLFDALIALAKDDPYFRANDWDKRTAAGLMIPSLKGPIRRIISSSESNDHLRFLLVEGIRDTLLAAELSDDLEAIMMSTAHYYREREDSVSALLSIKDELFWQKTIESLQKKADEDSTRLAMRIIGFVGYGKFDDLTVVRSIFFELGLLFQPIPKEKTDRLSKIRHYANIADEIEAVRIKPVLVLLTDYMADLVSSNEWEDQNALLELVCRLLIVGIEKKQISSDDASDVWHWLGVFERAYHFHRDTLKDLSVKIRQEHELRRAVQRHALFETREDETFRRFEYDLQHRLVGLAGRLDDVVYWLKYCAEQDNTDIGTQNDWYELICMGRIDGKIDGDVFLAAQAFVRGNKQVAQDKALNPPKAAWQIKQEKRKTKKRRKDKIRLAITRKSFEGCEDEIRNGDLSSILRPAKAYLGCYSDLDRELAPVDRVSIWLGENLCEAVLTGFEAVLRREDIPTLDDFACGEAKGTIYNYSYPIMAAFAERYQKNIGVADLPIDICKIGLLLAQRGFYFRQEDSISDGVSKMLEERVFGIENGRLNFAKLWIEPFLETRHVHAPGLYKLANDPDWLKVGVELAKQWITKSNDLPLGIEFELIDILLRAKEIDFLAGIARKRSQTVFHNLDHLLAWTSIDVIVRLDEVKGDLVEVSKFNPEFLSYAQNRVTGERHNEQVQLSPSQSEWIFSQFRSAWPNVDEMSKGGIGEYSPKEASGFMRFLLSKMADNTSDQAATAMNKLLAHPADGYSDLILHEAAAQKQKRSEELFEPLPPASLKKLLEDGLNRPGIAGGSNS